ncbi:MAG: hypothetical protein PWR14_451 [Thermosediminibacterales bacterium]|nr:hypothetical protein [Thermosediminibacterales bacterium]
MVISMTGYGRGELEKDGLHFRVEIRSVNSRYCEIYVRLPNHNIFLEEKVKERIKQFISRGKVDVYIDIEIGENFQKKINIDRGIIKAYYNAIEDLKKEFGFKEETSLSLLLSFPDVVTSKEPVFEGKELWEFLYPAVEQAIGDLIYTRKREGTELAKDISMRINHISEIMDKINERVPLVVKNYREKLKERVIEILGKQEVDQERLEMEIVIFADKSDINEEIVRIFSHIHQFRETMESDKPIGRKLDFILQEINREINTIGAKSNDILISKHVVEVKSELEKLREQVQNIE